MGIVLAACSARLEISCAMATLSTPWIISNSSTASRTLFDCRWPMNCQRALPGHSGIFAFASWILFSPKKSCPQSTAVWMVSGGCVLETASSVTEFSSRPARTRSEEHTSEVCSRAGPATFVFAKKKLSTIHGGLDGLRRMRLGNREQRDGVFVAPGAHEIGRAHV